MIFMAGRRGNCDLWVCFKCYCETSLETRLGLSRGTDNSFER